MLKRCLKFGLTGVLFGIVLTKAEVISWFRIQEMFRFDSFHMYGILGSAVLVGAGIVMLIKRLKLTSAEGDPISFADKAQSIPRYLLGGSIFGAGWALSGACPGPMYTLLGNGIGVAGIMILSAIAGTWTYGMLRARLPH